MNVPQLRMDKAMFLDWATTREERCELVGGRVVMMIRPRVGHARITRNLLLALARRLDPARWEVLSDVCTDTGPATIRVPDIVVVPVGGDPTSKTALPPVLAAEVLSDSTVTVDLGDKAAEYLRLPSLSAYLIVAQDEPKAWLYVRSADGFSPGPKVIEGLDAMVSIPTLAVDLPMAEVFAGVHGGDVEPPTSSA